MKRVTQNNVTMKKFNYIEVTYIPVDKRRKNRVKNLVVSENGLTPEILDFDRVTFEIFEVREREFNGNREDFESILN